MTQEQVQAPTEAKPEVTPEATPEVTEPTPEKGEVAVPEETVEATTEATELFDPTQYEAEDSPHRESFQQWKQEQRSQGWAEARETYSAQITEQSERQSELDTLYTGATQAYKTLMGRFSSALEKGQVDRDALNEVFQDPSFARATEAIGKKAQDGARDLGRAEGRAIGGNAAAEGFVTIGAKVLGRQSLAQEFVPRIQTAKTSAEGAAMVEDFIKKVKDIGYQQGLADNKSGTTHADDLMKRKGEKPAQNVGSAAGGKSEREELLDHTTSTERLRELRGK